MVKALTLFEKIWRAHFVDADAEGNALLYIDRHLVHEVTSAQAFEGLRSARRTVWRPDSVLATVDHQVPTHNRIAGLAGMTDLIAREQVQQLEQNCAGHGIRFHGIHSQSQGVVHVMAPETGAVLPGMTLVCGDSHTGTNGALATLSLGIGTSEVEQVLASQCLWLKPLRTLRVWVDGQLPPQLGAKDLILHIIRRLGCSGANGCVIEYAGSAVRALSMEARMTLCNMSVEAGARAGLIAYDGTTEAYVRNTGAVATEQWSQASRYWRTLQSDAGAVFDREINIDARELTPLISWGTRPDQVLAATERVPAPEQFSTDAEQQACRAALHYMGLVPGQALSGLEIQRVFIGSCTNGRIEDLRAAAAVVGAAKVAANVRQALVVPGSGRVKAQAEAEGLDKIFIAAGFEWRSPGCSMCNAMNPDKLAAGERCASTSNRNFEGRQGPGGRTHLMSPAVAAACALAGQLVYPMAASV